MLVSDNRNNNIVVPKDLKADLPTDYQGMSWPNQNRETLFFNHLSNIRPTFNVLEKKPHRAQNFLQSDRPFFAFERFVPTSQIYLSHFQVYTGCRAVSERDVLFTSFYGLSSLDTTTSRIRKLLPLENTESLSLSQAYGLLSGVHESHKVFLYDLERSKMLLNFAPFGAGEEIANKTKIVATRSGLTFYVAGNTPYLAGYDLVTGQVRDKVGSIESINDFDYSAENELFAFALDSTHLQLRDFRENNVATNAKSAELGKILRGHEDFNFCVKFMRGTYLASGGQDVTTRIWDIRQTDKELFVLDGLATGVSALEYDHSRDMLFCIETFGLLYAYKFQGGVVLRDLVDFFGYSAGMALTPSNNSIFLAIAKGKPGVIKFSINDY